MANCVGQRRRRFPRTSRWPPSPGTRSTANLCASLSLWSTVGRVAPDGGSPFCSSFLLVAPAERGGSRHPTLPSVKRRRQGCSRGGAPRRSSRCRRRGVGGSRGGCRRGGCRGLVALGGGRRRRLGGRRSRPGLRVRRSATRRPTGRWRRRGGGCGRGGPARLVLGPRARGGGGWGGRLCGAWV